MRKPFSSSSLYISTGLFLAASCSIIAEVDRTKIPQDDGAAADGGQGQGGTSTGGMSGKAGASGSAGTAGTSGSGQGGSAGDGGEGGDMGGAGTGTGGTGGMAGDGGEGGEAGTPTTPMCGDGNVDAGEECDDNGNGNGDGCDSTCDEEPGWVCNNAEPSVCSAALCGDGIVAGAEVCDDGNGEACGTCAGNAAGMAIGCAAVVTPTAATGSIIAVAGADLLDTDTLEVSDGSASIVFAFDSDDSVTSNAIDYTGADSAATVADAIAVAINASTLTMTANATTGTVTLVHDTMTSAGNGPIIEMVANVGFMVTGMAGGRARNCANGLGCRVPADCQSGTCTSNFCAP